jgi:GAF domain-containing protein
MTIKLPDNELNRLEALFKFRILDTEQDETYDAITRVAATILDTPIAIISFIESDRAWAKSSIGWSRSQSSREHSFCATTILDIDSPLVVTDATQDERFSNNPFVVEDPNIRFYCGSPLVTTSNEAVGAICVVDTVARKTPTTNQIRALKDLSRVVIAQLELRQFIFEIQSQVEKLKEVAVVDKSEIKEIYESLNSQCDTILNRIKARNFKV